MREPGGVGAVAAGFTITEDGKGQVAEGQLNPLVSGATTGAGLSNMANATVVEVYSTATKTLVGAALGTGAVAVA